jgi:hypothetical protein
MPTCFTNTKGLEFGNCNYWVYNRYSETDFALHLNPQVFKGYWIKNLHLSLHFVSLSFALSHCFLRSPWISGTQDWWKTFCGKSQNYPSDTNNLLILTGPHLTNPEMVINQNTSLTTFWQDYLIVHTSHLPAPILPLFKTKTYVLMLKMD